MPDRRVRWIFHGTPADGVDWTRRLWLRLRADRPEVAIRFTDRRSAGSSLDVIDRVVDPIDAPADVALIVVDAARDETGIPLDAYEAALAHAVEMLTARAERVAVIWIDHRGHNVDFSRRDAARRAVSSAGGRLIDLDAPIRSAAAMLSADESPWGVDGLTEIGAAIAVSAMETTMRRWHWWPTGARRRTVADAAALTARVAGIAAAMASILDEEGHRIRITLDEVGAPASTRGPAGATLGCSRSPRTADVTVSPSANPRWRRWLAELVTRGALHPPTPRSAGAVQEVNRLAEELGEAVARGIGRVRDAVVVECESGRHGHDFILFGRYRTAVLHVGLDAEPVPAAVD